MTQVKKYDPKYATSEERLARSRKILSKKMNISVACHSCGTYANLQPSGLCQACEGRQARKELEDELNDIYQMLNGGGDFA